MVSVISLEAGECWRGFFLAEGSTKGQGSLRRESRNSSRVFENRFAGINSPVARLIGSSRMYANDRGLASARRPMRNTPRVGRYGTVCRDWLRRQTLRSRLRNGPKLRPSMLRSTSHDPAHGRPRRIRERTCRHGVSLHNRLAIKRAWQAGGGNTGRRKNAGSGQLPRRTSSPRDRAHLALSLVYIQLYKNAYTTYDRAVSRLT